MFYFISLFSPLDDSPLRCIFQEQIEHLTLINNGEGVVTTIWYDYTTNVYSHILTFFKNLKSLSVMAPSALSDYPTLSLCYLPSTIFSSSILTHLNITVRQFEDCLCLLDGRLRKLTTLRVTVHYMLRFTEYIHNMVSFYK